MLIEWSDIKMYPTTDSSDSLIYLKWQINLLLTHSISFWQTSLTFLVDAVALSSWLNLISALEIIDCLGYIYNFILSYLLSFVSLSYILWSIK